MTTKPRSDSVLFSADSHVSDFPVYWNTGLYEVYGARAPHMSTDGGTSAHGMAAGGLFGDWIVAEGVPPMPTSPGNVGGFPKAERAKRLDNFRIGDAPRGAIDPKARLEAMDADGLKVEVLFPTYGLRLNTLRDAELQSACAKASNTWLAEYCKAAPDRLIGAMGLSIHDPARGVEELHRGLSLGLKGAMVPAIPPPELTYASMHYERFWAAAAEAGVPVTLHALPPPETAAASQRRRPTIIENQAMALIEDHHLSNILYDHPIQISLTQLILSGVLERHPKLRLVISEWGTSWIANFLWKMDGSYTRRREGLPLKMLPSEYFRRQIWSTFDRPLSDMPAATVELLQDRLMFASDYPHIESTWPESQPLFDEFCGSVSPEIRSKLAWQNCASLYGIDAKRVT